MVWSSRKTRKRRFSVAIVINVVVVLGAFFISRLLHSTTIINQSKPVISQVVIPKPATKQMDESLFSFTAPADWHLLSHDTNPFNVYTWVNTNPKDSGRSLKLYIDTIPSTLGVNRVQQVQTDGAQITPVGDVSDNCSSFTKATSDPPSTSTPAIWNGLPFLCDLGNYQRDVVGIVSSDGLNKVALSGPTVGRHNLFFTYNEQNLQGNYEIFTAILSSFKLK